MLSSSSSIFDSFGSSTFMLVVLVVVLLLFIQPLITLWWSWRRTNFSEDYLSQSLPYTSDMSGFAGLPDIAKGDQLLGLATTERGCENGFYMGRRQMTNVDCRSVCNATSADQFIYKYIEDGRAVVIDGRYLRPGGWCLPTSLARCNLNISTAVKSVGRYECVSKFPRLLGGAYGNDIVGCAPVYEFDDNLKGITYAHSVPANLVIGDLDERMPEGSPQQYRYTCSTGNGRFASLRRSDLGDRFQLHYDSCRFFDEDGRMSNDGRRCECSSRRVGESVVKPLVRSQRRDMTQVCSTCTSGYEIVDEKLPQYGSRYGVSVGVNCVDPVHIEYYKTQYIEMNGVIPCGTKTLLRLRSEEKRYGCQRALLNVTNTYTPEMLQRING